MKGAPVSVSSRWGTKALGRSMGTGQHGHCVPIHPRKTEHDSVTKSAVTEVPGTVSNIVMTMRGARWALERSRDHSVKYRVI